MISQELIDIIFTIVWRLFERLSAIRKWLWLKSPVTWDAKMKRAKAEPMSKCFPLFLYTIAQFPVYFYTFSIVIRQLIPRLREPRFPPSGSVMLSFGSTVNFFLTWGSLAMFRKKELFALCINAAGHYQFHDKKSGNYPKTRKLTSEKIGKWSVADLIVEFVTCGFVLTTFCGLVVPLVMPKTDPIYYHFVDLPENSTEWLIIRFGLSTVTWGSWSCYVFWTVMTGTIYILFLILYACIRIPRVPNLLSHKQHTQVVQTPTSSYGGYHNTTEKLSIKLFEIAYKDYRQFQIFIRPANDANYLLVPIGLAGVTGICIISGFATIKAYGRYPIHAYLLFPYTFAIGVAAVLGTVPVACSILESATEFKRYWGSRFTKREIKMRIAACRPMGCAAGPFGYVGRSIPMELMHFIIDNICNLVMTMEVYVNLNRKTG